MCNHWKKGDSPDPWPWWANLLSWIVVVFVVIVGPILYGLGLL